MIGALDQYGPTRPTAVLIETLNRLYHEFEADGYESESPGDIRTSCLLSGGRCSHKRLFCWDLQNRSSRFWTSAVVRASEARQCLVELPADRIERLVCYDPSEEMLDQCRQGLKTFAPSSSEFLSHPNELEQWGRFDASENRIRCFIT